MNRLFSPPFSVCRLACLVMIVSLLGCQSPGPHLRSKSDRETYYSHLSAEDRAAVDVGVLRKGMAPATVRLVWGRPTAQRVRADQVKPQTEWLYYRTRWVDQPTWEYTYVDRYGRLSMEFRMNRVGVPFVRARAVFENEQLVDWEESTP